MNHERIRSCLVKAGYDAELTGRGSTLTLEFKVGERRIRLVHELPGELLRVPKFHLAAGYPDKLAHVGVEPNGGPGEVCIADEGSTAVNTDRPELVYRETVRQHVELLTRLIDDPAYNRAEQLREFDAHWAILCRKEPKGLNELFVAWDGHAADSLQVKPARSDSGMDLRKIHIALAGALANHQQLESVRGIADWTSRPAVGKGLGVRVSGLEPPPESRDELLPWYFRVVEQVDVAGGRELRRLHKTRSRNYWLVFSAPIPDGETMFAIHWHSGLKGSLPSSEAEAGQWTVTPYRVRALSRESLVSRGGGSLDLRGKSVLLVGCGSVGSDLALRLTSAGVGRLTLSDPDTFSEENLYRHVLSVKDIGRFKTAALAREIALRHPWAEVTSWCKRLEQLRDPAVLQRFDVVVIAIGSPTVERVFAEYCRQEALGVPVMNCWLEGYGIGGHAILAMPEAKGCWYCAYVDPKRRCPAGSRKSAATVHSRYPAFSISARAPSSSSR